MLLRYLGHVIIVVVVPHRTRVGFGKATHGGFHLENGALEGFQFLIGNNLVLLHGQVEATGHFDELHDLEKADLEALTFATVHFYLLLNFRLLFGKDLLTALYTLNLGLQRVGALLLGKCPGLKGVGTHHCDGHIVGRIRCANAGEIPILFRQLGWSWSNDHVGV